MVKQALQNKYTKHVGQKADSSRHRPSGSALNKVELDELRSASIVRQRNHDAKQVVRAEKWLAHQEDVGDRHPDYYKRNALFYDQKVRKDIEEVYGSWKNLIPSDRFAVALKEMIVKLDKMDLQSDRQLEKAINFLRSQYKVDFRKTQLLWAYRSLLEKGKIQESQLSKLLVKRAVRSNSGVLVITVMSSPYPTVGNKKQRFSCKWDCYYCPNEPGQPRSYLHDEPSVLRGNQNSFDPVLQFTDRALQLAMNGHPVDKIELLVLGGTWSSYPHEYQETYCRDLFYAANTFSLTHDGPRRDRLSMVEEQKINETARVKIIGLTLETRPDCITADEIKRFRRYGCTRVQLGVQHIDEGILTKINRQCTTDETRAAIELLKDNCYKIDIHLMPNLPGSNADIDKKMFEDILQDQTLQVDQWKIYPCEIVPWTIIKKWFEEGSFVPYDQEVLKDVLIHAKVRVHPWIRLNRVIRDIPMQYVTGALEESNLRQHVLYDMKKQGLRCKCIRCREVKDNRKAAAKYGMELFTRQYTGSNQEEYFISFETPDKKTIFGFTRLRLSSNAGMDTRTGKVLYKSMRGCALVRELHVYGKLIATYMQGKRHAQHIGLGTQLMNEAERLALSKGYKKVAVIAGVGVRRFYYRIGYEWDPESNMMIKDLAPNPVKRLALWYRRTKPQKLLQLFAQAFIVCIMLLALLQSAFPELFH